MSLVAYPIAPGLAQGPVPPSTRAVVDGGFSVLVLCAVEAQPIVPQEPGLSIVRCPLVDDSTVPLPEADFHRALHVSKELTRDLTQGKTILVTCLAGLNRSGLVTALVLMRRYGITGQAAIDRVRLCRGANALHNPQFVRKITSLR